MPRVTTRELSLAAAYDEALLVELGSRAVRHMDAAIVPGLGFVSAGVLINPGTTMDERLHFAMTFGCAEMVGAPDRKPKEVMPEDGLLIDYLKARNSNPENLAAVITELVDALGDETAA
jgi:hypothetical protein